MPRAKLRYREYYNGVRIDLSAKDQKTLNEKVRKRKDDIDRGLINTEVIFKRYAEKWLTVHKYSELSRPVYKNYQQLINRYINPHIGDKKLKDITSTDIKAIINADVNGDWHKIKLRSTIKSIFEKAISDKLISVNPCANIKSITPPETTLRSLTDDERRLVLDTCKTHSAGLWIKLLLYTGIRPQESAALTWGDLEENTHSIIINKALKADGSIGVTKSKSSIRKIPVPAELWDELIEKKGKNEKTVFVSDNKNGRGGMPYNHQTIKRHWRSFYNAMKITAGAKTYRNKIVETDEQGNRIYFFDPNISLYYLRHTYATDLCRAGVPLRTAVALMGHKDTKMLLRVYSDFTQDQADYARNKLSAFYSMMGTSTGTNPHNIS